MSTAKRRAEAEPDNPRTTWGGWVLFGPRDKNGKHACKLCNCLITYSNSTSSFQKHLAKHHAAHWEEFKVKKEQIVRSTGPDPVQHLSIVDLLDPKKIAEKKEASTALVKSLEKGIVRFIVGDVRPFSAVEGAPRFAPSLLTS